MATATKNRKAYTQVKDTYTEITNQILALLEEGTVIWQQPWKTIADGMPTSLSTGKLYRGINIFILEFESMIKGYSSNLWGTYRQIQERGGQVRKGEKSTSIVFWKLLSKDVEVDGETKTKRIPLLRTYNVFNVNQCDWADDAKLPPVAERPQVDVIEAAEALIADYLAKGPSLGHGGDRAFYHHAQDHIQMPLRDSFVNGEEYYSTLYHEATHSTGHAKRLHRQGIAEGTFGKFGDPVYSYEELVAEMGAAMLSGIAGIEQTTIAASAAYLNHWKQVLKEDNKVIVQAAAQAQKAVDLILGNTFADNDGEES
jgi:antirestriction protein ArdC